MKGLRELLRDRRRSQRGSVLSGVLIITAFLSIIGGALMTELTTGFLLSRVMVNRVNAQATVNSAAELALDQLQGTARDVQCPTLGPPLPLNGQMAAVSYISCALVPDSQWSKLPIASSFSPFSIDGARIQLPGRDAYLVADQGSRMSEYDFGQTSARLSISLGGSVSGPPMAMFDHSYSPPRITTLVPVRDPSDRGVSPNCNPTRRCVASLSENGRSGWTVDCFLVSAGFVTSAPAAGVRTSNLVYFGDDAGNLYAYTTTGNGNGGDGEGQHGGGNGANCSQRATALVPGAQAIRGVVALRGANPYWDEVFVLTDSKLLHYTFGPSGLSPADPALVPTLRLPWAGAIGFARDSLTAVGPIRLAISFQGGGLETVQIGANGMFPLASTGLAAGITSAPYWSSGNLIGVGLNNGNLNVLDSGLRLIGTYAGTAAISTTPTADPAGDWFFGADDKQFYEVHPAIAGGAMTLAASVNLGERTGSSPVLDRCATGICVYLGTMSGHLYMVPFDARSVNLTACISDGTPSCPAGNLKLWISAEVGYMNSPRTVRVKGWSYYSG